MTVAATAHLDVAALREAFDRSFAAPPEPKVALENFLSIPIGADAWAVRLADVAGLFAGRTITALPSAAAAVLGLANVGGGIRPVFDLALLLGAPAAHAPRWLIVAAAVPIALAFAEFGGHIRMPASSRGVAGPAGVSARRHVGGWLATATPAPILDVRTVIDDVRRMGAARAGR